MALPMDKVGDIVKAGSALRTERDRELRVAVFIEADAPDDLVQVLRDLFVPRTINARMVIEATEPATKLIVADSADVLIAVGGSGTMGLPASLAEARTRGVPSVLLALTDDVHGVAMRMGHPILDTLVAQDAERLVTDSLAKWLVDRLPSKRFALAHNFPFLARAVAEEAVKATAWQNAAIGLVAIIPGTDMPLMTANQAKMMLQVAAAYGQDIGPARIRELIAVVGGGFLLRALARQALTAVPGVGWVVKGGVAYSGTLAMGFAAIRYFESGLDVSQVIDRLRAVRDSVRERRGHVG